ncbi:SRPBCC domain-containing protein [Caulobacter sp. SL161]|uniref:SRPBCC domain-containing protein n=1 Tax=Caulobacter sp. SL161 TaxID=2995156 RepID=UPI00227617B8|nr:SRPBCC domain-containing protein [Caulobacter sp. SL161]MCY1649178.1 SRPBCC domain-containing protein [Caulobacter sp. SL161]
MIIETQIDIAAPPMKVWRALTDFPGYPKWHPFRSIAGEPALGQKVKMAIGATSERRRKVSGRISVLSLGGAIAFDTGSPFLKGRELFLLTPSRRGTLLRHRTEMTGPAEFLFRFAPPSVANLRSASEAADRALDRYLTTNAPSSSGGRQRPRTRI